MNVQVFEAVADTLWQLGVRQVFGVAGSGNYRMTHALKERGAHYVSARHEGGAVSMADAFSRVADSIPVVSVHQGGGLTNTITGLTEAVKSHTQMIVLSGEAPLADRTSNFRIGQEQLVEAVGARSIRVSPGTARTDVRDAFRLMMAQRVPVLLNCPTDVQMMDCADDASVDPVPPATAIRPNPAAIRAAAELLLDARRPLIVGGRGARGAAAEIRALAERSGALLASSAVARGLFQGDPFSLDVMGDLASPVTIDHVLRSDVVIAFGAGLNRWTTSNGTLIAENTKVVHIDIDPMALGRQRRVDLAIVADAAESAKAIMEHIPEMAELSGRRRTNLIKGQIAAGVRWQDVAYRDTSTDDRIDPRAATIALDKIFDADRNIVVDSGNFLGYPTMFLSVPDAYALCFAQAFQCVGLGLASAIGHATARPDRLTIAACGDGGLLMGASELESVVRLNLPMAVLVYNDSAYGAEVHHFGRTGADDGFVSFPEVDFARIAKGYGFTGVTMRSGDDLGAVKAWVDGSRDTPLLIDIKVTRSQPSWWLADAFKAES